MWSCFNQFDPFYDFTTYFYGYLLYFTFVSQIVFKISNFYGDKLLLNKYNNQLQVKKQH